MKPNYTVCHCKRVTFADIANALDQHRQFDDVLTTFADVQKNTHCSTGCGGCYEKVLAIISEIMMG